MPLTTVTGVIIQKANQSVFHYSKSRRKFVTVVPISEYHCFARFSLFYTSRLKTVEKV